MGVPGNSGGVLGGGGLGGSWGVPGFTDTLLFYTLITLLKLIHNIKHFKIKIMSERLKV